jgi:hypothetical protein
VRDCEVLVSVSRVKKLVALAFITQSGRIQGSRSLEPAAQTFWRSYGRSGGFSVIRILKPWLCASSLGHGKADTG